MSNEIKAKKGLPSVEQPWMRYYDGEFKEEDIPDISIYQFAKERIKGKENRTALDVRMGKNDFKRGIKISYKIIWSNGDRR